MSRWFWKRWGRPQLIAGLLLMCFLGQCLWLVRLNIDGSKLESPELAAELYRRIESGLTQWRGGPVAGTPGMSGAAASVDRSPADRFQEPFDVYHSPLWYLIASSPFLLLPHTHPGTPLWLVTAYVPYLIVGVLLGAALWYVSRRLYGNAGGYIALILYCFSPAVLRTSALWFAEPEIGAAWGAFGAVFTAIAVAHTLYAPRGLVIWNWRRILLLGVALTLAIGCQFSLAILIPIALAFMLYLAPTRRAAVAIWTASCGVAFLLLFGAYGLNPKEFWEGLRHAEFLGITGHAFRMPSAYQRVLIQLGQSSPALVIAVPAALVVYAMWRRARYFGNTAPLLVALGMLAMATGSPHYPGLGFQLIALPFLFVFVAGVSADLLETRHRSLVQACVWGVLGASSIWNLFELARLSYRR